MNWQNEYVLNSVFLYHSVFDRFLRKLRRR